MINKVILVGRVGKDPELRHLDNNLSIARFTLATNETYKNKSGEKVTNTEWHNLIVWRAQAEFAGKYVKKGALIYVEGKIRSRSWDDKDGNKRYTTEIEVETIQLLGSKSEDSGQPSNGNVAQNQEVSGNNFIPEGDFTSNLDATDDLPF
jgi:single-strand DNA-binding protein